MEEQKKKLHPLPLILLTVLCGVAGAGTLSMAGGYITLFEQLPGAVQIVAPTFAAGLLILYFLFSGFAAFTVSEWLGSYPKNPAIFIASGAAALSAIPFYYLSAGMLSVLPTLLSASFILSGITMRKALSKNESRTVTVLYGSVPAIALSVAVILIYAFLNTQSVDFLTVFAERLRDAATLWAKRATELFFEEELTMELIKEALYASGLVGKDASTEQVWEMTQSVMVSGAEMIMMLLPGILVVCHNISSYFTTLSVSAFSRVKDRSKPFILTAGVFGAVLFVTVQFIPYLFSFASESNAGLTFLTVALNLSVIYTPLFFAIGIRSIFALKWKNLKRNILFLICGILLILTNPVLFISMMGGYAVIAEALKKMMERKFGIGGEK